MAGRNDYGVLRSSLLADERAHRAAELFVAAGLASEAVALSAVVGVVVELGLWAMRETDDGVLEGSGVIAIQQATMTDRNAARQLLEILCSPDVELLRVVDGGVYLTGFRDCYASILDQREQNRTKAANAREKARREAAEQAASEARKRVGKPRNRDVSRTSAPRNRDVTVTSDTNGAERSEAERSSPLPLAEGESGGLSAAQNDTPRPLRPRVRERFRRVLDYVVRCGSQDEIRAARALRDRGDAVTDAEVLEALERTFAWVTPERLARSLDTSGPRQDRATGDPSAAKAHVKQALAALRKKPRGECEPAVPRPTMDPVERERIRAAMDAEVGS